MRSRYRILERAHSHFITSTTVAWLPIFTTAARCDIIVDAFQYCRQNKGLKLYAWVILDTHFHTIVAAPELARVLADLKRHTARRIIEQSRQNSAIGCCGSYATNARRIRPRASIRSGRRDRIRRRS
jgi:REP-associated tyrosine transposase